MKYATHAWIEVVSGKRFEYPIPDGGVFRDDGVWLNLSDKQDGYMIAAFHSGMVLAYGFTGPE